MRKSLDSHYIEEVVYYANENVEKTYKTQIRPSLSDFKVERLCDGVYALTPKFKIDQKPGEKRPYYSFVKALLELEEQVMRSAEGIYSVFFYFPFPKGDITISEVDEELGELADNTDLFENVVFNWMWSQNTSYGKTFNEGVLRPSLVISEDGVSIGNSVGNVGSFSIQVVYVKGVPFVNETALRWEEI